MRRRGCKNKKKMGRDEEKREEEARGRKGNRGRKRRAEVSK